MLLDFQIPHPSIMVFTSLYLQRWKKEWTLNFRNYPLTCSFLILGWKLKLLVGIVLVLKHGQKGREPWDSREVWVSWSPSRAGEGCLRYAQSQSRSQAAEGHLQKLQTSWNEVRSSRQPRTEQFRAAFAQNSRTTTATVALPRRP